VTPAGAATASPTAPAGVSPTPPLAPDASAPLPALRLVRAFPGLSFDRMTGMYVIPDGSGRLVVTEQAGRALVFEEREEAARAAVFLDIRDRVNAGGNEEGLLGLAFAPDYSQSGHVYVNYTASNPRRTVVSRFTARGAAADPASELIVLQVNQPFANHNGGQIAFGPDGFLYIGLGDGGSGGDPQGNGQNLGVLLGKLLRIDVAGATAQQPYRVPADNPFVERSGARGEIWAYGLRNPWRFSFDPATGRLWLADVGQNAWEEVDVIVRGGNYGWNRMEGAHCYAPQVTDCDRSGLVLPVAEYPRAGGDCSVTGGFVYRGEEIAALRGAYVYGDYCSGRVWALRYDGARVTEQGQLAAGNIRISSFAVDGRGNLYALAHGPGGGIFRLAR
jgi:glucose/arabinose dehydrogenase